MFTNAKNLLINGGSFTTNLKEEEDNGRKGFSLLQPKIAVGAFHDSDERYDPPRCHPRTRQAILKKIMDWVQDPKKSTRFLWVRGPAGAGKSAIAQTIAEMCQEISEESLAATFFFSRTSAGRNEKSFLVATLAYQLALSIPEIQERVGKALQDDPLLLSRSLEKQMQMLVIRPLNEVALDEHEDFLLKARPHFIILDGLDECGDPFSQKYILKILSRAVKQLSFPFHFLIASRPEQHICEAFDEETLSSMTSHLVLDDAYNPDADIRIFLESRFAEITRRHPSRLHFPVPWPSHTDVDTLVQKSSGQFIFASTVMKFLDSHRHWPPDRLEVIFGLQTSGPDLPFDELDALYLHIFSQALPNLDKVLDILIVLLLGMIQKKEKTPIFVEEFLFYKRGESRMVMSDLPSIIAIPPSEDTVSPLRVLHASLGDFLLDRSRSGRFFIDIGSAHAKLARLLIKHLARGKGSSAFHQRFLRRAFMEHCLMSQPEPDLLRALDDFDLGAHLNWYASNVTNLSQLDFF